MKKIFLSYSWSDDQIADEIERKLKRNSQIELHRDKLDIDQWAGIREYMQSIPEMDYVILLISDAYLKSVNCMYEVLEVMRDRKYRDKIFPAVVSKGIYKTEIRVQYVRYWQTECEKLKQSLTGIAIENMGNLGKDLKQLQDISSNVAEFLDMVTGMNNPAIEDVCEAIECKLTEKVLDKSETDLPSSNDGDLFRKLGLASAMQSRELTEYDIDQFMRESFIAVTKLFEKLCQELQKQDAQYRIVAEKVDSRTVFFQFYKNGKLSRGVKIFLGNMGSLAIGISTDIMFVGNNNSWNGMYIHCIKEGKIYLKSSFSYYSEKQEMTVEEVVVDIWKQYVQLYLR